MKLFTTNDLWSTLKTNIGSRTPVDSPFFEEEKTVVKTAAALQGLGKDSKIPLSNHLLYNNEVKKDLDKEFKAIAKEAGNNFDKTELGKKLNEAETAIKGLASSSGKTFVGGKEVDTSGMSFEELSELAAEQAAIEAKKNQGMTKAEKDAAALASEETGKQSPKNETVNELVSKLQPAFDKFKEDVKEFYTKILLKQIKESLMDSDNLRGKTVEDIFNAYVISNKDWMEANGFKDKVKSISQSRIPLFQSFVPILNIMKDPKFASSLSSNPNFEKLNKFFSEPGAEERHPLENRFNADMFARRILSRVTDILKENGPMRARIGSNFTLQELPGGNFAVNRTPVDVSSLNSSFQKFLLMAGKTDSDPENINTLRSFSEDNDMRGIAVKAIVNDFMKLIESDVITSKQYEKQELMDRIDKKYEGVEEDLVTVFKNIITSRKLHKAPTGDLINKPFNMPDGGKLILHEVGREFIADLEYTPPNGSTFYYEDNNLNEMFNQAINKNSQSVRNNSLKYGPQKAAEKVYGDIIRLEMSQLKGAGRIDESMFKGSSVHDAIYFELTGKQPPNASSPRLNAPQTLKIPEGEIVEEGKKDEERKMSSRLLYRQFIRSMASTQMTPVTTPDWSNPTRELTTTVTYNGISFRMTFRGNGFGFEVSDVDYISGDRHEASTIHDILFPESGRLRGSYDFDTSEYTDISSDDPQSQKAQANKLAQFYKKFIVKTITDSMKLTKREVAPDDVITPEEEEKPQISDEELLARYEEDETLSKLENPNAKQKARMEQLDEVLVDNADRIVSLLPKKEVKEFQNFLDEIEGEIESLTPEQFKKYINYYDWLENKLNSDATGEEEKAKIEEEMLRVNDILEDRGDFDSLDGKQDLARLGKDMYEYELRDVPKELKPAHLAIAMLESDKNRKSFKATARKNLDKHPEIKKYLLNSGDELLGDVYKKFVELVYAN